LVATKNIYLVNETNFAKKASHIINCQGKLLDCKIFILGITMWSEWQFSLLNSNVNTFALKGNCLFGDSEWQ